MRPVNRCAVLDKKETPLEKVCVYLWDCSIWSTLSLNYANKLICAGSAAPHALQPCLRLRADRVLRHNTVLQKGKSICLVNYHTDTQTQPYTQSSSLTNTCTYWQWYWAMWSKITAMTYKMCIYLCIKRTDFKRNHFFFNTINMFKINLHGIHFF